MELPDSSQDRIDDVITPIVKLRGIFCIVDSLP